MVATDLRARSDRAIDRAIQLGHQFDLPVTVLHVAEREQDCDVRMDLQSAVRLVLPTPDDDVGILTLTGPVPRTIAETASDQNAVLLVTGVARLNSLSDYILGTAVDKIIRYSKVPVLVVKHRPHRAYGRIVCAVDFSPHSGGALCAALRLFPQAELIALHAYHVPYESWQKDAYVREETERDARKNFEGFIANLPVADGDRERIKTHLEYGGVGEVLQNEIARVDPDLVVFGTHGMGGFRQATLGSIASSLLQCTVPDALIVPRGE